MTLALHGKTRAHQGLLILAAILAVAAATVGGFALFGSDAGAVPDPAVDKIVQLKDAHENTTWGADGISRNDNECGGLTGYVWHFTIDGDPHAVSSPPGTMDVEFQSGLILTDVAPVPTKSQYYVSTPTMDTIVTASALTNTNKDPGELRISHFCDGGSHPEPETRDIRVVKVVEAINDSVLPDPLPTFAGTIGDKNWSSQPGTTADNANDFTEQEPFSAHSITENTPPTDWGLKGYQLVAGLVDAATCGTDDADYVDAATDIVPNDSGDYTVCVLNQYDPTTPPPPTRDITVCKVYADNNDGVPETDTFNFIVGDHFVPITVDEDASSCETRTVAAGPVTISEAGNDKFATGYRIGLPAGDGSFTPGLSTTVGDDVAAVTFRNERVDRRTPTITKTDGELLGNTGFWTVTVTNPEDIPQSVTVVETDGAGFSAGLCDGKSTCFLKVPANDSVELTAKKAGPRTACLPGEVNNTVELYLGDNTEGDPDPADKIGEANGNPVTIPGDITLCDEPFVVKDNGQLGNGVATWDVTVTNPDEIGRDVRLVELGGGTFVGGDGCTAATTSCDLFVGANSSKTVSVQKTLPEATCEGGSIGNSVELYVGMSNDVGSDFSDLVISNIDAVVYELVQTANGNTVTIPGDDALCDATITLNKFLDINGDTAVTAGGVTGAGDDQGGNVTMTVVCDGNQVFNGQVNPQQVINIDQTVLNGGTVECTVSETLPALVNGLGYELVNSGFIGRGPGAVTTGGFNLGGTDNAVVSFYNQGQPGLVTQTPPPPPPSTTPTPPPPATPETPEPPTQETPEPVEPEPTEPTDVSPEPVEPEPTQPAGAESTPIAPESGTGLISNESNGGMTLLFIALGILAISGSAGFVAVASRNK